MRVAMAAVSLLTLTIFPESGGLGRAFPDRPPCAVARDWVKKNPHIIPAKLNGFALFPRLYKRAAYNDMSEAERISLWRQHLAVYSSPASKLTSIQKQFIDSVSKALPQILLQAKQKPTLDEFHAIALNELGKRAVWVVFGSLGAIDPTLVNVSALAQDRVPPRVVSAALEVARATGSTVYRFASAEDSRELSSRLTYINSNLDGILTNPSEMNTCSCHVGTFDFCNSITGPTSVCYETYACEPQSLGCGLFWAESCNGLCSF